MRIDVISLFPEMMQSGLSYGVVGRAVQKEALTLQYWNPREDTTDNHRTVDDRPFGGGPGMVMMPQPLDDCIERMQQAQKAAGVEHSPVIYLSPQGKKLDHQLASELAELPAITLLCGRYEGIDERLLDKHVSMEVSIGDYVLSGGELAALVVVDSVSRLLPGVLGHQESAEQDSFVDGLLDCPHYTRPAEWQGRKVPDVLLSGDHAAIERWRKAQALQRTKDRRPDLLVDQDGGE